MSRRLLSNSAAGGILLTAILCSCNRSGARGEAVAASNIRLVPALIAAICVLPFSALALAAQDPGPEHAPDFRAQQFLIALYFGPKTNAPFTAIAKTTWVKIMPDNSTITTWNDRVVARDMDGRIFQERRTLVADNSKEGPRVRVLEYSNPQQKTFYSCNPYGKICNLSHYYWIESEPLRPVGLQPDGMSYLTRENLGIDTYEGLEVQRSRETFTYFKQTIGNTKTILRVVDYWYSPALGINVKVVRHDPRDGDQTLWLTNISLSAPDPSVFQIPTDYQIFDRRTTRPLYRGSEQ